MDTQGILALEARRYAAMTTNDLDALAALFHDDMVYTHSSGVVDNKASYIEALRSGRTRYLEVEQREQKVTLLGDVALVVGASHIEVDVVINGEKVHKSLDLRSLAAWTATPAGWQFIAWQSCSVKF
jgi:ketosteroid isomerase-like protein